VRRSGVIILIGAAIATGARADEPAARAPDLDGEIVWARATWPDLFRGVRFRVPVVRLRAWAPPRGEVPAYLFAEEHCVPITIERERRTEDDEGYGQGPPALTGRVIGRTSVQKGRPVRYVRLVAVGEELESTPANFTIEAQDARGRWRSVGGTAIGMEPTSYGWLSYVDDRVARWDAAPQRLHIESVGPVEPLACAYGGERSCKRFDHFAVYLVPFNTTIMKSDPPARLPATCDDPCPPDPPDSVEIARLRRLEERVRLWRPQRTRTADIPSLYRSQADCEREHPQVVRTNASKQP
jgi:hypothetical protein